ncbi:CCPP5 [Auxenochlorella protothecoides x Auxenochlorella symbiontica]
MTGLTLADHEVSEASKQIAEDHKNRANEAFKAKHYQEAVDAYTAAIDANPRNAVYLSNRAFANLRLENLGSALADASAAIELDPTYAKAYYRRGDAAFALAHFKDAVRDFKAAARLAPRDPDLRRKLAEAEKQLKRARFEEALSQPDNDVPVSDTIVLDDVAIDSSYCGPALPTDENGAYFINLEFIESMLEAFKRGQTLHRRYVLWIVLEAQRLLKALPSLVHVDVPAGSHITVCGDTHGQFFDLLRIFQLGGAPSEANPYLFNGDFVDRGSWSVEVMLTLLAHKCLCPGAMHLTRGNHEAKSMNLIYGFYGEVREKCGPTAVEVFRETFCWLPLGYVLRDTVLVLHGGLFSDDGVRLDELAAIQRYREPPEAGHMCEMLWSDPKDTPGREPNKRGVGIAFGPDVTRAFLQDNGLSLLVRSHEVKDEGYEVAHDGYCITIFSAPNYCDQMGNKGAFIRFKGEDMVPAFTQFEAAPHPDVKPMKYAASMMNGMFGM